MPKWSEGVHLRLTVEGDISEYVQRYDGFPTNKNGSFTFNLLRAQKHPTLDYRGHATKTTLQIWNFTTLNSVTVGIYFPTECGSFLQHFVAPRKVCIASSANVNALRATIILYAFILAYYFSRGVWSEAET